MISAYYMCHRLLLYLVHDLSAQLHTHDHHAGKHTSFMNVFSFTRPHR